MNQSFMQYNEESAKKAGGGEGLSEGGAYICEITSAKYTSASTGTHGIEFEIKTVDGLTGKYITAYYAKANNEPIKSGQNILNAMMGVLNIPALSFASRAVGMETVNVVPELEGKTVGLFLQKKLFTKNDGKEGYSFSIRTPFNPVDSKTLKEIAENKPAQAIERMSNSYKDLDERQSNTQQQLAPDYGDNYTPAY
jgi:hypothetical protein